MELVKKNVHMNKLKGKAVSQMTLDDDFNVSDQLPDMKRIIIYQGEIQIESVRTMTDKVLVKGKLSFKALYHCDDGEGNIATMSGMIPFEETINMNGIEEEDNIQVRSDIEDLNVGMINSRKLSVKALVLFSVTAESIYDEETAVSVDENHPAEVMKKNLNITQIAMQKKDTYRVKEEVEIPNNQPNISNVLWEQLDLRNADFRLMDGSLSVRGEVMLFVIYQAEEEHIPIQWFEKSIQFSGTMDVQGCTEDMIPSIDVQVIHKEVAAKPDYDGENRIMEVDAVLELDMKLYEEENVGILSDIYSPAVEIKPEYGEANFESLMMKNVCKCKVGDKLKLVDEEKILQICHSEGNVKIDDVEVVEDGLLVEGVLLVSMLYMSADDREPMKSFNEAIPFKYVAEVKNMDESCSYQMRQGLEQMTSVMLGNNEVEVKAIISLDILVLKQITEPTIKSIDLVPVDMEKIQNMPGIVGYIVQPGDSLWVIAKRFHTTVDEIKSTNGLTSDDISPGTRLMLIKKVEEFLS